MLSYTYTNLNSNFTLKNICYCLEQLWIGEVKALNCAKIWLTITVTSNKKSYILINNLPFNISDYPDIVIVLRQALASTPLHNNTLMESITFKFFVEKPKSSIINKIIIIGLLYLMLILLIIFLSLILFIIYLEVYPLLDNDIIYKEILDNSINIVGNITQDKTVNITNNKYSFLGTFLQYFNKSPSSCLYYPSCFLPSNLNPVVSDFNLLEYILYKQYNILDTHSILSKQCLEGLNSIVNVHLTNSKEYIEGINNVLEQYKKK